LNNKNSIHHKYKENIEVNNIVDRFLKIFIHTCIMRKLDKDDMVLKAKIASRIKSLRKATGKGMTAFAKDTDKDKQSQNRWEKQGASISTINKFCKEIGISLSEFFNDPLFEK